MIARGLYRIAMLPGADERSFVQHVAQVVDRDEMLLQSTRITRAFSRELLKSDGRFAHYVWQVTADLVTDAGYDFHQNVDRLQERIEAFGVVIGVDTYTVVSAGSRERSAAAGQ